MEPLGTTLRLLQVNSIKFWKDLRRTLVHNSLSYVRITPFHNSHRAFVASALCLSVRYRLVLLSFLSLSGTLLLLLSVLHHQVLFVLRLSIHLLLLRLLSLLHPLLKSQPLKQRFLTLSLLPHMKPLFQNLSKDSVTVESTLKVK